MSDAERLAHEFADYARTRLQDALAQIERCLNLLSVEQVWDRPNSVSNAVGNLVLYLAGNLRQWILSGLGGEPDERDRPAEFAQRAPVATEVLLARLTDAVTRAGEVIGGLGADRLLATVSIQNYTVTGLAAVFHVVEHFSLHAGQIVYATKAVTGLDLSLYDAQGQRIDGR